MSRRVKTWDDVVGHQNLIRYLKNSIEKDNIPNVVLLHGNSGLGKSSIAKLLAVEITARFDSELKASYVKSVIEKNESTDAIKLFNMSEIQEKEEEIQKVKSELSTAFTRHKRKVLILDECHNMSKKAQDAILTELEHLPEGIYIIFCTTEVNALRSTLLSRCKGGFRLNNLTEVEARQLCRRVIQDNGLTFNMNVEAIVILVCDWAQNQPRRIVNLFDNFEKGSLVSTEDIEVFVNTTESSAIVELVKYLYGSMVLGIEYINSMKMDESFVTMLIEITKVVLGQKSQSISTKDATYIRMFMAGKDEMHLIRFTAEVAGMDYLRKRKVISAFMKSHSDFTYGRAPEYINTSRAADIKMLNENVEEQEVFASGPDEVDSVMSIEEMFEQAVQVE